jgi:hypothetical protein
MLYGSRRSSSTTALLTFCLFSSFLLHHTLFFTTILYLLLLLNWVIRIMPRSAMAFVPLGDIALRFGKYLGRSNHPKNPLEDFRR